MSKTGSMPEAESLYDGRDVSGQLSRQGLIDNGDITLNRDTPYSLHENEKFYIRARGLPWASTDDEIAEFFEPQLVLRSSSQITRIKSRSGRFSGEIFLELYTPVEVQAALSKNHETMGRRYIEIFDSNPTEFHETTRRSAEEAEKVAGQSAPVVKLRGLPFQVHPREIEQFLAGISIAEGGIHLIPDSQGRGTCNGEAYVQLRDQRGLDAALAKNKHTIGSRWIEVFQSSEDELLSIEYPVSDYGDRGGYLPPPPTFPRAAGTPTSDNCHLHCDYRGAEVWYEKPPRPQPFSQPYRVRLRGLPFDCSRTEVFEFFYPARPVFMEFIRDERGKILEGFAEFDDPQNFQMAMSKDRLNIRHRYIELFDCTESEARESPAAAAAAAAAAGYSQLAPPPMKAARLATAVFHQRQQPAHSAPAAARPPSGLPRLKMRGVPFDTHEDEIYRFFDGIELAGVTLVRDRATFKVTEALAQFFSCADLARALERNNQNIRHRYIELFEVHTPSLPAAAPHHGPHRHLNRPPPPPPAVQLQYTGGYPYPSLVSYPDYGGYR